MEKDIIKNISIEDFKTNKNFVDYIDDDFLVANSLKISLTAMTQSG